MIDHRGNARGRAAHRVETHARGARVEHALQPVGTAVGEDRVAGAPALRAHGRRRHLLDDDFDQPLDFLARHACTTRLPDPPDLR